MSDKPTYDKKHSQEPCYEIRLKGHLDNRWSEWFENLTITLEADNTTLLSGTIADQAALHGLLKKIRDLGIQLISVNQVQLDETPSYRSKRSNK